VDPLTDVPPGFTEEQRDRPGGFTGEEDVMDTWGTSSLTPQISSHWGIDDERHKKLFPADLRPQAHDIIRTWAFYTIVKAWQHEGKIPWKHAAISGFILDPDRKKMSKSKGNVMTPEILLNEHSSDVFRYWAARGRLGVDSAFDETPFKIGRKLVIKLFNASKFVLTQLDGITTDGLDLDDMSAVCTECDRSWLEIFRKTLEAAYGAFEQYDYTTALQLIEETFWNFCDNYLEMVKIKAYEGGTSPGSRSALVTLNWSLKTFLRLFAPFMPFITEEIWSWRYSGESVSVHKAAWPMKVEIAEVDAPKNEESFPAAMELISLVRGFKTTSQVSQKRPVARVEVRGSRENLDAVKLMIHYIMESTNAESEPVLTLDDSFKEEEPRFKVTVELGEYKE